MKLITRLIQLVIVIVPIGIFGWLGWQDLVPTGELAHKHSVEDLSPFINRLLPDARALPPTKLPDGTWATQIIDDPVYFTVEPPRHFDSIDLELMWQNEDVPIMELGGLAGAEGSQYFLEPLQNLTIDNSDWDRIERNGLVFLQRKRNFESIADFLVDLPLRDEIATYHYRLAVPYLLDGYRPSSQSRTIDVSLRGFHEYKTYIKDETLNFILSYMDMNRDNEVDPVKVLVTADDGTLIAEFKADDDGNSSDNADPSGLKRIKIEILDLPEGVYKIELRVGRDIFWRQIITTQSKIVFLNNVYLADEVGYQAEDRAVSFWTEAKNLIFETHHADGAQEVTVGGDLIRIPEPYVRYGWNDARQGVTTDNSLPAVDPFIEVHSPQGDLIVNSNGHIAFDEAMYFNPDPVRLSWDTDLDQLGVDYIIAAYESPKLVDGWYVGTASFDTSWLVPIEEAWKFTVSLPGISDLQGEVWVSQINAVMHREPLTWEKIKQEIWERL
ncbi:MAG: hypothetical protein ABIG32_03070 [Candidatus Uhrbacteria bacterium]|nr:hypothetical protein [Patescibacteria group bacterium]MBU1906808.1 hypothetical protein [Patescibacteria group bacterium]